MVTGFRRLAVTAASAAVLASAAIAAGSGAAHSAAPPGWRITTIYPEHSEATQIVAGGPANAWVAETCGSPCHTGSGGLTLRHWNGTAWQVVADPAVLSHTGGGIPLLALPPGAKSSPWAVYPYDPAGKNRGAVAVRRTGGSWAAPHWFAHATITAAVAPTSSVAWVFGTSPAAGASYAQRWNGSAWSAAPSPKIFVVSASARSATDIWVTGVQERATAGAWPMVVSHWNGTTWATRALPRIAVPAGDTAEPLSIAVSGAHDAWALGFVSSQGRISPNDGLALYHWTGSAWSHVPVPYRQTEAFSVAGDGHGGVWFWAELDPGHHDYLIRDRAGHWTETVVPRPAGAYSEQADSITAIPGTTSMWAAGWASFRAGTQATILKYGV